MAGWVSSWYTIDTSHSKSRETHQYRLTGENLKTFVSACISGFINHVNLVSIAGVVLTIFNDSFYYFCFIYVVFVTAYIFIVIPLEISIGTGPSTKGS